ncbi:MAG TPA: DUF1579 family protein, partial [Candidatus Polarisedimenticolia bacterium]|nr:DUF1579 family protein [Candidatus Polarisedimenticolia bacterium]
AAARTAAPATSEALLRSLAGTWNATMQIAAPDDAPPQIINALEVNRLGGGGAWLATEFRSQMEGRAFEGNAILAFNPATGKLRRVWADVTAPTPWRSEGNWDASTGTLTMWIETTDSNGHPVRWREETVIKDENTRTFTMYAPGAQDTEAAAITIAYRRRTEGSPPQPYKPAAAPPSPEHAVLARDAGTWNARLEASKDSKFEPKSAKGTEINTLCCDGLFLVTDLEGSARKDRYAGHGLMGYDPQAKAYWSAWVDTADRDLDVALATWDEATKTLTIPLGADPAGPTRETLVHRADGGRTLTFWQKRADGQEFPAVVIQYQRSRDDKAPPKSSAADR